MANMLVKWHKMALISLLSFFSAPTQVILLLWAKKHLLFLTPCVLLYPKQHNSSIFNAQNWLWFYFLISIANIFTAVSMPEAVDANQKAVHFVPWNAGCIGSTGELTSCLQRSWELLFSSKHGHCYGRQPWDFATQGSCLVHLNGWATLAFLYIHRSLSK